MNADGLILISVDDHIAEPANMFDAHVPSRFRDHAPRVITDDRGAQQWRYGDIKGRDLGLNAVAGKPREMCNVDASRYDEMRSGCFDVHERVREMNAGGQLAGLNMPSIHSGYWDPLFAACIETETIETIGPELIEHFELGNVCWESDYPHSEGTWPEVIDVGPVTFSRRTRSGSIKRNKEQQ
jgi:hypothetical protein